MDSVRCAADHGCLDFLCQRFSSCIVTKPVNSETHKQNGCQVPTMVLSEAHGLSLFRVIREGLGSSKRLCARGAQRLTYQCRLASPMGNREVFHYSVGRVLFQTRHEM